MSNTSMWPLLRKKLASHARLWEFLQMSSLYYVCPVNPFAIKYVKLLKLFLRYTGAWPGEIFGEHVPLLIKYHRIHLPLQGVMTIFGESWYVYDRHSDMNFFLKGHCFIVFFLTILTTVRCALPNFRKYHMIFKSFFTEFHLCHFKNESEYHMKIYNLIDKVSFYFTWYLMLLMIFGGLLFNVSPWYLNYKNGAFSGNLKENATYEFSVYYLLPGFDPHKHFTFTTIYNLYLCGVCAFAICTLDLLLSVMVFQIIGHLQILRNSLETMPKPKKQSTFDIHFKGDVYNGVKSMFDDEENLIARRKLIDCIHHHQLISRFTNDMSRFFGPMLALNYSFHLFSCCVLLLECSQGDPAAILRFGPLTIIMFGQLIQISVIFEVVGTVSEKLKDSVYWVPWESMDVKNRRIVLFFLRRVQKPIIVTAMGLTPIGVTTMAGILKTTLSYFALLRSMTTS